MRVYIDKNNLESLVSSAAHPLFLDCNRMLKNKFDIYFNFKKEEIKDCVDIKQWIATLSHGFCGDIKFLETLFPVRPLKSNMHNSFNRDQLSSIYMIDDEKGQALRDNGCFLISTLGEEVSILSHLMIKDKDYSFEKKLEIKELTCWRDFSDYISPCSDIILIDKFILQDHTICECNIYGLLCELAKNAKRSRLNIVIVTEKGKFEPNWNEVKRVIKSKIKSITNIEPNVTFILPSIDINEHDRTIFTNYKRIYSGDSFNYFKSDGGIISKGREVQICSLADRDNMKLGFKLLDDIQSKINIMQGRNPDLIIGDKKCNYLDFE